MNNYLNSRKKNAEEWTEKYGRYEKVRGWMKNWSLHSACSLFTLTAESARGMKRVQSSRIVKAHTFSIVNLLQFSLTSAMDSPPFSIVSRRSEKPRDHAESRDDSLSRSLHFSRSLAG